PGSAEIYTRSIHDALPILRIEVADNGVGIESDRLEALLERLKHPENMSSEHIGLVNVQERIQLYYGSRYGLSIRSQAGIGTTVTDRKSTRLNSSHVKISYA